MSISIRKSQLVASLALSLVAGNGVLAAAPTAQDALSLQPVQKDVDIERPTAEEAAKCSIKAEGKRGWVIRDPSGEVLRAFPDSNGDNVVDQWCYYKDGVEVYRDIDTNFNKKADQCRWLNTGGSRWGVDRNEDGKIDFWKNISPEEVTAELVAAMRDHDRERFERILLNANELKARCRPGQAGATAEENPSGGCVVRQDGGRPDGGKQGLEVGFFRRHAAGPRACWHRRCYRRPDGL